MDLYGSSIAVAIHSLDHSLSARLIAPTEICVNMNGIDYKRLSLNGRLSRCRRNRDPNTNVVHPLCWLISRPIGASCREFAARHPRASANYFASSIRRTAGVVCRGIFVGFRVEPIATPFVDISAHVEATVRTDAGWIAANGCRPLEPNFAEISLGGIPFISPRINASIRSTGGFLPLCLRQQAVGLAGKFVEPHPGTPRRRTNLRLQ